MDQQKLHYSSKPFAKCCRMNPVFALSLLFLTTSSVSGLELPADPASDFKPKTSDLVYANFEWSMSPRFGLDNKIFAPGVVIDASDGLIDYDYSICYLHPDAHASGCPTHPWLVKFDAGVSSGIGLRYNWDISGDRKCDIEPTGSKAVPDPFVDPQIITCRFATQGSYTATLRIKSKNSGIDSIKRNVNVKDLLIVSIGDSVASGEGNPDRERKIVTCGSRFEDCIQRLRGLGTTQWQIDRANVTAAFDELGNEVFHSAAVPAQWQDRRCHRSAYAGPAQAAKVIENSFSHTSVTFLHLACSGAGILEGLINGYKGIEAQAPSAVGLTDGSDGKLPGQIKHLIKLLCPKQFVNDKCIDSSQPFPIREIDVLLISAGANDVNFGDATIACTALQHCGAIALNPPVVGGYQAEKAAALIHDVAVVDDLLAQLPGKYEKLKAALESIPNLEPGRVFLTEYFDPTHSEHGNFCNTFSRAKDYAESQYGFFKVNLGDLTGLPPYVELDGITSDESNWAFNKVLSPLNKHIKDAALKFGWNYIGGIANAFRHHGLCSSDRWVNLLKDSTRRQADLKGPMHPNFTGHTQYLLSIFDAVMGQIESERVPLVPVGNWVFINHGTRHAFGAKDVSLKLNNQPPVANAGRDQLVRLDSSVVLDGTRSFDPDSGPNPLIFSWEQTAGPALLAGTNQAGHTFTVTPTVEGTYAFSLTVFDGRDYSAPDNMTLTAPMLGDFDGDEDVDNHDRVLLRDAIDTKASGPNDIRDLDNDGMITRHDELALSRLCTRPRCATE